MTGITQTIPVSSGTWTPIDASGAALTFSVTSATYTKIGNIVFAFAAITYPATADVSQPIIGGLPFAAANSGYGNVPCQARSSGTYAGPLIAIVVQNTTTAFLNSSNGTAAPTNANFSGTVLRISLTYPVS